MDIFNVTRTKVLVTCLSFTHCLCLHPPVYQRVVTVNCFKMRTLISLDEDENLLYLHTVQFYHVCVVQDSACSIKL